MPYSNGGPKAETPSNGGSAAEAEKKKARESERRRRRRKQKRNNKASSLSADAGGDQSEGGRGLSRDSHPPSWFILSRRLRCPLEYVPENADVEESFLEDSAASAEDDFIKDEAAASRCSIQEERGF